jgi:hypothetical protein
VAADALPVDENVAAGDAVPSGEVIATAVLPSRRRLRDDGLPVREPAGVPAREPAGVPVREPVGQAEADIETDAGSSGAKPRQLPDEADGDGSSAITSALPV